MNSAAISMFRRFWIANATYGTTAIRARLIGCNTLDLVNMAGFAVAPPIRLGNINEVFRFNLAHASHQAAAIASEGTRPSAKPNAAIFSGAWGCGSSLASLLKRGGMGAVTIAAPVYRMI